MHCNCCDKLLDNEESTARFVTERGEPLRYVEMCRGCRSFLPPEVRIITRQVFDESQDDVTVDEDDEYGYEENDE